MDSALSGAVLRRGEKQREYDADFPHRDELCALPVLGRRTGRLHRETLRGAVATDARPCHQIHRRCCRELSRDGLRIFLGPRCQYVLDCPVFRVSRQKSPAHDGACRVVVVELLDADVSRRALSGRHSCRARLGRDGWRGRLFSLSENLLSAESKVELRVVAIHLDRLQPRRHRPFGDGGGRRLLLHRRASGHRCHLGRFKMEFLTWKKAF